MPSNIGIVIGRALMYQPARIIGLLVPDRISVIQVPPVDRAFIGIVPPVLLLPGRKPVVDLSVIIPASVPGHNLNRSDIAIFGVQPTGQHRDLCNRRRIDIAPPVSAILRGQPDAIYHILGNFAVSGRPVIGIPDPIRAIYIDPGFQFHKAVHRANKGQSVNFLGRHHIAALRHIGLHQWSFRYHGQFTQFQGRFIEREIHFRRNIRRDPHVGLSRRGIADHRCLQHITPRIYGQDQIVAIPIGRCPPVRAFYHHVHTGQRLAFLIEYMADNLPRRRRPSQATDGKNKGHRKNQTQSSFVH